MACACSGASRRPSSPWATRMSWMTVMGFGTINRLPCSVGDRKRPFEGYAVPPRRRLRRWRGYLDWVWRTCRWMRGRCGGLVWPSSCSRVNQYAAPRWTPAAASSDPRFGCVRVGGVDVAVRQAGEQVLGLVRGCAGAAEGQGVLWPGDRPRSVAAAASWARLVVSSLV
jgi:hypothetical protein